MNIEILMGIWYDIYNNKHTDSAALAEKYEISRRSVYRYVNALANCGMPIEIRSGKGGGFYLMDKVFINQYYFTDWEISELIYLCKTKAPPSPQLTVLLEKLQGLLLYKNT